MLLDRRFIVRDYAEMDEQEGVMLTGFGVYDTKLGEFSRELGVVLYFSVKANAVREARELNGGV